MSIEQIPSKFRTQDGQEFDTAALAQRHQRLLDAREAFDAARQALGFALLEDQRTADGQPFALTIMRTYYYVAPGWGGMPRLLEVSFCGFNFDFEERTDGVVIRQRTDPNSEREYEYRIGDLYYRRPAAERALLAATEEWLVDVTAQVEALREKVGQLNA